MKESKIKGGMPGTENRTMENNSLNQVDFELLTTENRVYQILRTKGESMHITEIISELNRLLLNSNSTEVYQNAHLDLTADDRFNYNNSIGYYELAEWNLGEEIVGEVIEKDIHIPAASSTYLEILNKIKKERPESEDKTINGLISIKCLGLKDQQ